MSAKFATTTACLASIVSTLQASSTLAAAVSAAFPGKVLRYWIGFDEAALPDVENSPMVILSPGPYGRNGDSFQRLHSVQVCLVIESERTLETLGVTTFPGLATSETLALAIDAALLTWIDTNFNGIHDKTPFATVIQIPAIKTLWQYDFQDQM